jgi:hypothetical protein
MQAYANAIVVRLAPQEYRNLVRLAVLLNKSLSDVVREYLCLPPESEASAPTTVVHSQPRQLVR